MFKGLANIGSLMKQAQQMSGRVKELGEELKTKRVTGSAGGGMVEIEANGANEMLRCRIDPTLFTPDNRELLEDMVVTAVNQALGKAKQLHAEAMCSLTGGMNIPGLDNAVNDILGPLPPEGKPGEQP